MYIQYLVLHFIQVWFIYHIQAIALLSNAKIKKIVAPCSSAQKTCLHLVTLELQSVMMDMSVQPMHLYTSGMVAVHACICQVQLAIHPISVKVWSEIC